MLPVISLHRLRSVARWSEALIGNSSVRLQQQYWSELQFQCLEIRSNYRLGVRLVSLFSSTFHSFVVSIFMCNVIKRDHTAMQVKNTRSAFSILSFLNTQTLAWRAVHDIRDMRRQHHISKKFNSLPVYVFARPCLHTLQRDGEDKYANWMYLSSFCFLN